MKTNKLFALSTLMWISPASFASQPGTFAVDFRKANTSTSFLKKVEYSYLEEFTHLVRGLKSLGSGIDDVVLDTCKGILAEFDTLQTKERLSLVQRHELTGRLAVALRALKTACAPLMEVNELESHRGNLGAFFDSFAHLRGESRRKTAQARSEVQSLTDQKARVETLLQFVKDSNPDMLRHGSDVQRQIADIKASSWYGSFLLEVPALIDAVLVRFDEYRDGNPKDQDGSEKNFDEIRMVSERIRTLRQDPDLSWRYLVWNIGCLNGSLDKALKLPMFTSDETSLIARPFLPKQRNTNRKLLVSNIKQALSALDAFVTPHADICFELNRLEERMAKIRAWQESFLLVYSHYDRERLNISRRMDELKRSAPEAQSILSCVLDAVKMAREGAVLEQLTKFKNYLSLSGSDGMQFALVEHILRFMVRSLSEIPSEVLQFLGLCICSTDKEMQKIAEDILSIFYSAGLDIWGSVRDYGRGRWDHDDAVVSVFGAPFSPSTLILSRVGLMREQLQAVKTLVAPVLLRARTRASSIPRVRFSSEGVVVSESGAIQPGFPQFSSFSKGRVIDLLARLGDTAYRFDEPVTSGFFSSTQTTRGGADFFGDKVVTRSKLEMRAPFFVTPLGGSTHDSVVSLNVEQQLFERFAFDLPPFEPLSSENIAGFLALQTHLRNALSSIVVIHCPEPSAVFAETLEQNPELKSFHEKLRIFRDREAQMEEGTIITEDVLLSKIEGLESLDARVDASFDFVNGISQLMSITPCPGEARMSLEELRVRRKEITSIFVRRFAVVNHGFTVGGGNPYLPSTNGALVTFLSSQGATEEDTSKTIGGRLVSTDDGLLARWFSFPVFEASPAAISFNNPSDAESRQTDSGRDKVRRLTLKNFRTPFDPTQVFARLSK